MQLDRIIRAKQIITLDDQRPTATAMGILNGRIVGFDDELDGCEAPHIDQFQDRVIVPGFIDAHCHTTWWGLGLTSIALDTTRGLDELYDAIRTEAERLQDAPLDEWIHGTGFNQKHYDEQFPDIRVLDEITGERPLYLRHTSGHAAITNSATLRLLGALDADYEDPVGGKIVRDDAGYPTGLVEESAQSLIQSLLLPYSATTIAGALDAATKRYAAEGITSFCEAGVGGGWIGHSPVELAGYQLAAANNQLHCRATLMPAIDSLITVEGDARDFHETGSGRGVSLGIGSGFGDERIRLGHVKAFMDGSLLGRTAAVTESYCGHDHSTGYLLNTPEEYREQVHSTYRAGWPIALHAIGDAAIDLALDLIEECQQTYGMNQMPNRIEHFGIARPDQVERAGQLQIAVTPQASFTIPLGDQMIDRVGPERADWLYRARSLVEAGVLLAGSSDLPVAPNNVRVALQSLVDRTTEQGQIMGPDETITPEQALRSYTQWSAIAIGEIDDRGTLEVGKLADFVVLSDSPLTAERIDELEVVATFVGGTASYTA